jgi:hypothetical protein
MRSRTNRPGVRCSSLRTPKLVHAHANGISVMMGYVLMTNDGETVYDFFENRGQVIRELADWVDAALAGGRPDSDAIVELHGVVIGQEDSDGQIEIIAMWADLDEEVQEARVRRFGASGLVPIPDCTSAHRHSGIGGPAA